MINTFGAPTVVLNNGLTVVTYNDSSAHTSEGEAFQGFVDAVRDGLRFRLTAGNPTTYVWAQAFGADTSVRSSGVDVQDEVRRVMSGISTPFGSWGRGGVFVGPAEADRANVTGNQSIDAATNFGGAYARFFAGQLFADAIVTGGATDSDSRRLIKYNLAYNGIEYAKGSYEGWFISPELPVDAHIKIVPSLSGGFTRLSLDGFAETGALAAVSIASRDIDIWDGRAQLELRFRGDGATEGWKGALRGALKTSTASGGDLAGVLAATTAFTVKGSDGDRTGGFVGADVTYSPLANVQLYAGGEVTADGDGLDTQGRAGASVKSEALGL